MFNPDFYPTPPDFRALCAKVIQYNEGQGKYNFSHLDRLDREDAAFDAWQEIRSEIKHALAQPVPPGEEWDALVDRAWDKYETIGYHGERFMYNRDFGNAVELVLQQLARWGNTTPQPVPPIDGEVAELVDKCIATYAEDPSIITSGSYMLIDDGKARADLVERLSPPQPVPVSERPDTRRLRYLMHNGPDGFAHVERDRYEYAMERAEMAGRDEPNEDDELNGFRLMIDAAIANDTPQPVTVSERLPGPEDCDKEIKVAAKVIPGDNQQ